MKRKLAVKFLVALLIVLPIAVFAASELPPGRAITPTEIEGLVVFLARFLIVMSVTVAVIMLTLSGIFRMMAMDNPERLKKARATFKNVIYGALIVLGVGVIINTLAAVVTREFFCQVGIFGICIF